MKILFQSPLFSSSEDKAAFLASMQKLPAYVGNTVMGTHFLLELNSETIEFESIKQLSLLFDEWKIDKSPLD